MTPEMRERFAVLVERRLAGLLSESETNELSRLLQTSVEARELYSAPSSSTWTWEARSRGRRES
jgi:hypothetical protein